MIRGFQDALGRCRDEEACEEDARQASAVLPSAETPDKILRYETKLERQMCRAMAQFERAQLFRGRFHGRALAPGTPLLKKSHA